jgi:glycosyltransferase involved in cell wall biosynthesis
MLTGRRARKHISEGMSLDLPLASCTMPTANRRRYVSEAIRLFLAQDYPEKELVVLDDAEDSVAHLIPKHPQIRLDRRHSLGVERNVACEVARGSIIVYWDDEDWYAVWCLSRQVTEIVNSRPDLSCARMLFFGPAAQSAWENVYPLGEAPWMCGATFCYRKSIWQQSKFVDSPGCEGIYLLLTWPEYGF